MEPADQFYGNRSTGVRDPFGNHWFIATHVEDVPAEELARRERNSLKRNIKTDLYFDNSQCIFGLKTVT